MKRNAIFFAFTLVFASTVSAQSVVGVYDMVSSGSCIHSEVDFVMGKDAVGMDYYDVPDNSRTWGATTSAFGTWEFYSNGTGKADIWNYPIDYPPGSAAMGPRARSQHLMRDIKYLLNGEVITIKMYLPDGTFATQVGEIVGSISSDKKTIVVPTVMQKLALGAPLYYAVCNTMRTFIRVGNIE